MLRIVFIENYNCLAAKSGSTYGKHAIAATAYWQIRDDITECKM